MFSFKKVIFVGKLEPFVPLPKTSWAWKKVCLQAVPSHKCKQWSYKWQQWSYKWQQWSYRWQQWSHMWKQWSYKWQQWSHKSKQNANEEPSWSWPFQVQALWHNSGPTSLPLPYCLHQKNTRLTLGWSGGSEGPNGEACAAASLRLQKPLSSQGHPSRTDGARHSIGTFGKLQPWTLLPHQQEKLFHPCTRTSSLPFFGRISTFEESSYGLQGCGSCALAKVEAWYCTVQALLHPCLSTWVGQLFEQTL